MELTVLLGIIIKAFAYLFFTFVSVTSACLSYKYSKQAAQYSASSVQRNALLIRSDMFLISVSIGVLGVSIMVLI